LVWGKNYADSYWDSVFMCMDLFYLYQVGANKMSVNIATKFFLKMIFLLQ